MRRAILAATLLAAATVPVAHAATPRAGSGSLNEAPLIEPGEYRDTILPGEQLFYAVRVQPGQRLALRARVEVDSVRFRDLAAVVAFRPLGPLRETVEPEGEAQARPGAPEIGWELPVPDPAATDPYRGPGVWYLAVHAQFGGGGTPPRAEIPFTFALERAGEAGSTPTTAPTPAPVPRPARDRIGEGPDPAAVGAIGMSGLIVGLAGGALLGRRRRR